MDRNGRHKIDPWGSGEPGPMDAGYAPIIPFELEQLARADPEGFVSALAEEIVPVGGWAAYGAAEFALDVMDHDLEHVGYRALFVAGLEARRAAGVPPSMLNTYDDMYWSQHHPDEPWLEPKRPPARDDASITPLAVGEERRVAQYDGRPDSKAVYVTRPSTDRYLAILDYESDDTRVRGDMYDGPTLYDLYVTLGARILPSYWNDPEFEAFAAFVRPRL